MTTTTMTIFKAGQHVDNQGQTICIDCQTLQKLADNYDHSFHEAPLVIGHPKDDAPAYGWIKQLKLRDDHLEADIDQIHPDVVAMVNRGAFRKLSASFYTAQSPLNPKPGELSLRHVGLLGATPPAVKGLPSIEFSDTSGGASTHVVQWTTELSHPPLRRLLDWLQQKLDPASLHEILSLLQQSSEKDEPQADLSQPDQQTPTLSMSMQALLNEQPQEWTAASLTDFINDLHQIRAQFSKQTAASVPAIELNEVSAQDQIAATNDVSQLIQQAHQRVAAAQSNGHHLSFAEAITLTQQENTHV